ncbi:unnamed protein product [Parascedosporium putredinis]|uniref:RNB domain-containing protein n=1 Tax=Parascedosporium putredinis TaxID=1442378 RepID=A0A9P1H633_9PEZI|nr:unnamed protein product [Parascedosporium putredinis]CAI7997648.1 unnamed protein product [Parascedosporium putredinis]
MLGITRRSPGCNSLQHPGSLLRGLLVPCRRASHQSRQSPIGSQRRNDYRDFQRRASDKFLADLQRRSTIRDTLKKWEAENPQQAEFPVCDSLPPGELPNSISKSQALGSIREAREAGDPEESGFVVDGMDSVDDTASVMQEHLRPGTLIELRLSDSRIPLLGVILGRFHGVYYFLTNGGQLAADEETHPLVDFLPKDRFVNPREVTLLYQPPIELCAPLQKKLQRFDAQAHHFHQTNLTALSAAESKLPHPSEFSTLSLHQIAQTLIPNKVDSAGTYDPATLYAVHVALMNDETHGFRPLNKIHAGKHVSYLYRISPASSNRIIKKVRTQVRQIMETLGSSTGSGGEKINLANNGLWRFIIKTRRVIKESRARRSWTDHGMLVPHHEHYEAFQGWTKEDQDYLHFMELWVGSHVHQESILHCFGSSILHLTQMYQPAKQLNAATGWTFLQELGCIPSWELPTRHKSPIPGAKVKSGGGYDRPSPGPFPNAPSTTLLDDAVSVEPAGAPGEYWIHAHIADPAAFIDPKSKLADYAAIIAQDHFIPGYRCSMFPPEFYDEIVMKNFSLDKDRPCLTFSTKLNEDGQVLDVRVQPGTLQNITFLTPGSGPSSITGPQPRALSKVSGLSEAERDELQTLHRLLTAVDVLRLKRGAIPQSRASRSDATKWSGDPMIEIGFDERKDGTLVGMAMMLAGESAAKWCSSRSIPVPYHAQPGALRNPEGLRALGDQIRALTDSGADVPMSLWRTFDREAGPTAQSVFPSPIIPQGLEMYTKVTSPLRRLADCIVHWQIHAALAEEARLSASLAGQDCSHATFLPWDRPALGAKLESLRLSNYVSQTLSRGQGSQPWLYQALFRAWKFGEAQLPPSFRFTVSSVYGGVLMGELDYMGFSAMLRKRDMGGVALMADVQRGDVLEVEIRDINVYSMHLFVGALRLLGKNSAVAEDQARLLAAAA